jgi:hypothetical protein
MFLEGGLMVNKTYARTLPTERDRAIARFDDRNRLGEGAAELTYLPSEYRFGLGSLVPGEENLKPQRIQREDATRDVGRYVERFHLVVSV